MGKRKLPETSIDAYKSLDVQKLTETKQKIIASLSALFEANHEEIASYMKVDRSVVWKRLNELEKAGLIYKTGNKKALRSGRAGMIYRLTGNSLPKTQAAEKALKGRSVSDYARSIAAIAKTIPPKQLNLEL